MPKLGSKMKPGQAQMMARARYTGLPTLEDRFWSKVDKNAAGGCWVFTGGLRTDGYGQFWVGPDRNRGKIRKAHHVSLLLHGWPEEKIPKDSRGMVIDHICRNKACVNPDHLRLVTQTENTTIYSVRKPRKSLRTE